jgi:hypothetical protein
MLETFPELVIMSVFQNHEARGAETEAQKAPAVREATGSKIRFMLSGGRRQEDNDYRLNTMDKQ